VKLEIAEERLFVISDLHLGNPASSARQRVVDFIDYTRMTGASLCLNGDGFELLQTSFTRLAADTIPVINAIRRLKAEGHNAYYVVGNHDIALEHFLEDWLFTHISPFLNLSSGDQRVRIEHGHIYDSFFMRYPDVYEAATRLAGLFIFARPDVYSLWAKADEALDRRRRRKAGETSDDISALHEAAGILLDRGFDAVVFGHTHNPETVVMPERGVYVNSGNWLRGSHYVDIDRGTVTLKRWEPWSGASN
jgi:UDP-2,3-diacylglucosamine pyrophosphatase LpxH